MHTSDRLIPRAHLADISAWEMGSFDQPSGKPAAPPPAAPVRMPTVDDLAALENQAFQEGYQRGATQAADEATRLAALVQGLRTVTDGTSESLADGVLDLALDLARAVLREAIAVRPELLLPLVREAVQSLTGSVQSSVLSVHPSDLELVRQHLGDELAIHQWRLAGDERIEAGGCRIAAAQGDVDATLGQRWKRAMEQLGRDDAWLV